MNIYSNYVHLQRFGKGKLTLPDGSSYDGEWINNRKEGKGTFIWSDGTKYSGNWMSDKVSIIFSILFFLGILLILYIATWKRCFKCC